jgi:hypothetical protein
MPFLVAHPVTLSGSDATPRRFPVRLPAVILSAFPPVILRHTLSVILSEVEGIWLFAAHCFGSDRFPSAPLRTGSRLRSE